MHSTLAFMTLRNKQSVGDYLPQNNEFVILKYAGLSYEDRHIIDAIRAAKIAELLDEFDAGNIREWHGLHSTEAVWQLLLEFSDEVLIDRFGMVDDLVSRVLGGSIRNQIFVIYCASDID
jgi:ATP-dependent exoDNAse (exonuclease V) alpha subunit